MKSIIQSIKNFPVSITLPVLEDFVQGIDFTKINYANYIRQPEKEGDYGRYIGCDEPFECVLINWPAGVESAVHLHDGLIGCVLVLEGQLENFSYQESPGRLVEIDHTTYEVGDIMREEDGAIHKLKNCSSDQRAITLHFYFPALLDFEDMHIYDLENGDIGILSASASSAIWNNEPGHFKNVLRKAFNYVPLESTSN
jgi:cysteine dioxygenase